MLIINQKDSREAERETNKQGLRESFARTIIAVTVRLGKIVLLTRWTSNLVYGFAFGTKNVSPAKTSLAGFVRSVARTRAFLARKYWPGGAGG